MDIKFILLANLITIIVFFYLAIIIKISQKEINLDIYHYLKYSIELLIMIMVLPYVIVSIISEGYVRKYNERNKTNFSRKKLMLNAYKRTYGEFGKFFDFLVNEVVEMEAQRIRKRKKRDLVIEYAFRDLYNDIVRGYIKKNNTIILTSTRSVTS